MTFKEFIKDFGKFVVRTLVYAAIIFLPAILAVVTQQPAWFALYGISGVIILYALFK